MALEVAGRAAETGNLLLVAFSEGLEPALALLPKVAIHRRVTVPCSPSDVDVEFERCRPPRHLKHEGSSVPFLALKAVQHKKIIVLTQPPPVGQGWLCCHAHPLTEAKGAAQKWGWEWL